MGNTVEQEIATLQTQLYELGENVSGLHIALAALRYEVSQMGKSKDHIPDVPEKPYLNPEQRLKYIEGNLDTTAHMAQRTYDDLQKAETDIDTLEEKVERMRGELENACEAITAVNSSLNKLWDKVEGTRPPDALKPEPIDPEDRE